MTRILRIALAAALASSFGLAVASSGPTRAQVEAQLAKLAKAAKDPEVAKQITRFAAHASDRQKRDALAGKTLINFPKEPAHTQGNGAPFCKFHYGCHIHLRCHPSWWSDSVNDCSSDFDCPDPDCV